jgi:hypothetical protein
MLLALHNVAVIAVTIAGKSVRDGYFLSRFDKSALPLMMCAIAVPSPSPSRCTNTRIEIPSELLLRDCSGFAASLAVIHLSWKAGRSHCFVWMEDHRNYGSAVLAAGV